MLLLSFYILIAVNVCLGQQEKKLKWFDDCGSQEGTLVSVSVSDCHPEDKRCILKKNKDTTITITLTNVESKAITAEVCGALIKDLCIPFPLPESDGCKSGIVCPVTRDQTNTYKQSIAVSTLYPNVQVDVKWKLKGENGEDLICLLIRAAIR